MRAHIDGIDHVRDIDGSDQIHGAWSMAPTAPAPPDLDVDGERVGPDGTPLVDDPVETADRQSRLADELAALADQLVTVLEHQATALGQVTPTDERSAEGLRAASTINARAVGSVELIRDSLGEQHVVCDELADRIRHLFRSQPADPEPIGTPRFGKTMTTLAAVAANAQQRVSLTSMGRREADLVLGTPDEDSGEAAA